ncbi:unnamed protein product [Notodromas monacha]|uniref:Cytochrome P450 n=1 Tax=Notodromas monacha TaxID=399045 RepID=A0A7R9GE73_9CRUS|nr:unnamed protein product [Notodromas monacha]CAG0919314.1 unnamed protein product [Notodromas monacha]
MLAASVTNVISSVLMSVRYKPGDVDFQRFMHLMDEGFRLFTVAAKVNVFPVLRFLPRMSAAYRQLRANRDEMHGYFRGIIAEHRATLQPEGPPRDLVDAYLHEMMLGDDDQSASSSSSGSSSSSSESDSGSSSSSSRRDLFCGKDPDRQLCQIMSDLFSAGQETVKTTLQWAVLFMLHNPEVQERVQEELDAVLGSRSHATLADAAFLPYTEATICEVLRRSNVAGLGTTHATTCDVRIDNHLIPKDTQVLPLLWAVHMDPELWPDPESFRPARFLNDQGKVHKPEYFMPFGIGRRMCLGDVLAKMEIFLFFTSLLHAYTLLPDGDDLPNLDAHVAATIAPSTYKVGESKTAAEGSGVRVRARRRRREVASV